MKNKLKKIIASFLVLSLAFTYSLGVDVKAEEQVANQNDPIEVVEEQPVENESDSESSNDVQNEVIEEELTQDDSSLPDTEETEEEINTLPDGELQNNESNSEKEEPIILPGNSSLVEYFYVGSPYLTTPATQQFVLSFGTGTEGISSVKLQYQKDVGEELELDVSRQQANLYVFEKSFSEAESGTYKVSGFTYVIENQTYKVNFSDLEMDIRFGVNQEYEGYGTAEGYTVDENGNEVQEKAIDTQGLSEAEIDTSVVTLDGSNVDQTEALVEDALQNNALPSTKSRNRSNSISTYSETNPLVICIDPGHGGNDSGTIIVNGAYEKNYNLKIAQYLKAELEQYKNVRVVMTRTGDTNPSLQQRAQIAADAGATALVSIHLNATGWGTQSTVAGAEVYYPSSNYNAATSTTGKNLAQNILNQLVGLGIQNRGIKVKYVYDTVTGQPANDPAYDYPDGSVGDYYGVIRYSKLVGVSGIIVEHCMADNWNDFNQFLSSDAKLQQLGVADATGIAKAFGLSKVSYSELDALAMSNKNAIADGVYYIQTSKNSNYVLDVSSASIADRANIAIYQKNGGKNQAFKVTHDSTGYVTFTNVNSGKAIDVQGGNATSGANVFQYSSNGGRNQKWIVIKTTSGYKVVSALHPNLCLDLQDGTVANSTNVQICASNDSSAQRWNFEKYSSQSSGSGGSSTASIDKLAAENKNVLNDGTYTIRAFSKNSSVLDVQGASTADRANVFLYSETGGNNQAFKVTHDSNGYVTFTNANSGKVLDVQGAKAIGGANVFQYSGNGGRNQKWIVRKTGSAYEIVSAMNPNLVLDLTDGKTHDRTNVQICAYNGSNAQKWVISSYESMTSKLDRLASENKNVLKDGTYIIGAYSNNSSVLDVQGASGNNRANIFIYHQTGGANQKFKVTHDSKGYVTFMNVNSGKVIDVQGAKAIGGANVFQYSGNGGRNQKWIVRKTGSAYEIVSAMNPNLVLDLTDGKTHDRTNVQICAYNGSNAQKWIFKDPSNTNVNSTSYAIMGSSNVNAKQLVNYYNSYKGSGTYDKYTGSNSKYNGTLSNGGCRYY